ncbi:MAG TPA: DUF4129 domain-containing protein [Steroidobacteraceae bacterium]|nr:DUF4129 domain-containing protein [Steroidobacteraceae bacterium]
MYSRRSAAWLAVSIAWAGAGFAASVPPSTAPPSAEPPAGVLAAPIPGISTREEIRAAVAKLSTDPNLGGQQKIKSLRWKGEEATPANAPAWIVGFVQFLGRFASVLLWAGGAVAVGIVAIWVIRTLRSRVPSSAVPSPAASSHVGDMDIRPGSLPDDIGAAALSLLGSGRTRDALSLLYRGALSRAVHRFGVKIGESYTEGEALKAVRAGLDAARAAYFSELVGIWQRAVYAGEAVANEPVARLCDGFRPALDGAGA